MRVESSDLAGPGDLAQEHGVDHATITFWSRKKDFPAPVTVLSCGKVWLASEVRKWVKRHRETTPKSQQHLRRFVGREVKGPGGPVYCVWDRQLKAVDSGPYASRYYAAKHARIAEADHR